MPFTAAGDGAPPGWGGPAELLRAVPADAWIAIAVNPQGTGDPAGEPRSPGTLEAAAFVLNQVRRMGLVPESDPTTAAVMDVVGSLPLITRHPYALCLLGGSARALPGGGHRIAELRAALIVRTGGQNAALEGRIQHLLNTYVNTEVATVETRGIGQAVSHRLTDRRLPDWARIAWGPLGDHYVLTLGSGAFVAVAAVLGGAGPALADDAWFKTAHRRYRGGGASVEWTVRFDAIREHLQPIMAGKPDEVLRGLGLGDVDRGLWAVGASGRATEAYAVLRRAGQDEFVPICRQADDALVEMTVPPQAERYALLHRSPGDLVRWARDAYLASRSASAQANLRRMWARIETETDINVDRDLLAQLGRPVVIHDYPQHPLGIPLARTIVVPVTGSAAAVRTSVDRLLRRYQRHLERPDSGWPLLRLHRADDGVWYFQAGLYGPALTVTDHWLVIGYSPVAVRQNLAYLEASARRGAAAPPEPAGARPGP